jgi:hypothetical protein
VAFYRESDVHTGGTMLTITETLPVAFHLSLELVPRNAKLRFANIFHA